MKKETLLKKDLKNLSKLRKQILGGPIPKSKQMWGGCGVIITSEKDSPYPLDHWKRYPCDLVIRTSNYKQFSWLVFMVQEMLGHDKGNGALTGRLIDEALKTKNNLRDQMLYVIDVITHLVYKNHGYYGSSFFSRLNQNEYHLNN